jgi:alpha-tubulin suppressor-like RCC1 family protein
MCSTRVGKLIHILGFFLILFLFAGCGGGGGGDSSDTDGRNGDGGGSGNGAGEATLTVVSTSPSNGSLGVSRDVQIEITFSQPIDVNTLTDKTVTLSTNGVSIPASLTLNDSGATLRLSPEFPLSSDTSYEVVVATSVKDMEGNFLASDFKFSFITVDPPVLSSRWTKVGAGFDHSMAINENGTLWVWGCNYSGGLGNGTNGTSEDKHDFDSAVPIQVGNNPDWVTVTGGRHTTYVIMNTGMLWGWGEAHFGSTHSTTNTPSPFGGSSDWVLADASIETQFVCAIKKDGTLWAWGTNVYGQLGNGQGGDGTEAHNSIFPVQVNGDTNWAAVSAGAYHAVAVKKDGTLWAWGRNEYGELGTGTGADTANPEAHNANAPVQIGTGWAMAAAKGKFTMGIKTDGTLWAWGSNEFGQLGIGASGNVNSPRLVGPDWAAVAPGTDHVVAIKKDGTLWAWGSNEFGQLGDGTRGDTANPHGRDSNVPKQIGSDTDWSSAASGSKYTLALKKDGSLWAWGRDEFGQLGDGTSGTNNSKNAPVRIR